MRRRTSSGPHIKDQKANQMEQETKPDGWAPVIASSFLDGASRNYHKA